MMKMQKTERSLSTIAALLLFAVFAVGVLSVLLGGVGSYRRITERDENAYHDRTGVQYLMTKLRQAESPEAIGVASFGGGDALQITQMVDGEGFITRIYCYDGWLMELFTPIDGEFSPADGERVLSAASLKLGREENLLELSLTDSDGKVIPLRYALQSGEGVA